MRLHPWVRHAVGLLLLAACASDQPVEVEPDPYVPSPEPMIAECDVLELRGEVVDCTAVETWCDSSEAGVRAQLACCDCSAASCLVHLSSDCQD